MRWGNAWIRLSPTSVTQTAAGGGGLIFSDNVRVAWATGDSASIAVTVKLAAPAVVGVPDMTPAGESDSPAGSAPELTDHVSGGIPAIALKDAE